MPTVLLPPICPGHSSGLSNYFLLSSMPARSPVGARSLPALLSYPVTQHQDQTTRRPILITVKSSKRVATPFCRRGYARAGQLAMCLRRQYFTAAAQGQRARRAQPPAKQAGARASAVPLSDPPATGAGRAAVRTAGGRTAGTALGRSCSCGGSSSRPLVQPAWRASSYDCLRGTHLAPC